MGFRTYIRKFIAYSMYGIAATIVDFSILVASVELFGIHYIIGTILAFVAAVTVNYLVFRRTVFRNSFRNHSAGYSYFFLFATLGLFGTAGLMALCIEILHFDLLLARIVTAILVGIWNFSMNYFFNFKPHDYS